MKKYLFIIAAAATLALVACNKEKELRAPEEEVIAEEERPGYTYITAVAENEEGSKARIDGNSAAFSWSANCKIAVFANGTYHVSTKYQNAIGAGAKFVFDGGINAYRSDFAVYPSYLVHDGTSVLEGSASNHTAASLKITLPASYTLAQVLNNESPTPMIAVNNPFDSLEFKSICALLRLTVNYIPKDAEYLKVIFPGKKVNGEFTLTNFTPGTDGLPVVASTTAAEETITITDLGITEFCNKIINVPVPVGKLSDDDYRYVRVEAYDNTDHRINGIDTPIKVDADNGNAPLVWNPNRKTSRKVTVNLPYFTSNSKVKTYVVFAPGNLVGTLTSKPADGTIGSANNFRFAEHQYDALGNSAGNRFASINNPVDLFAWIGNSATGTFSDDQKWGIVWPNNAADAVIGNVANEYIKWDWGEIFNGVTYPVGTWRLPNKDLANSEPSSEWARLTVGRDNYSSGKVTLIHENEGADADTIAHGLVIFPDKYSHPYGFKTLINCGKGKANTSSAHYNQNIITLEEWDILEKIGGCVFLPVTNARYRSGGANVSVYNADGTYWVNSANNSAQHAAALVFSDAYICNKSLAGDGSTTLQDGKSMQRKNGCAVRLIRDVN